jgi:hypothetical protein
MIKLKNTIHRGYIVLNDIENINPSQAVLRTVFSFVKKMEKRNYVFSPRLIKNLLGLDKSSLDCIFSEIKSVTSIPKGKFLRTKFAISEDISKEDFDFEDFLVNINMYFSNYCLGTVTDNFSKITERNVKETDLSGEEILKNIQFIDSKSEEEFLTILKDIVYMPIVFGEEQLSLIEDAFRNNLLLPLLNKDIKVKENLFEILSIIGKENIKKVNLFKTSTDVLRYAFFVSNKNSLNWKSLILRPEDRFSISTSDSKIIMDALNKIDLPFAFNDMKSKKNIWLRLSKNIHPGSSKFNKFPTAQKLFDFLRNGGYKEVIGNTFNERSQLFIRNNDYKSLYIHYKKNKGLILRNLDMLLRKSSSDDLVFILKDLETVTLNPKLIVEIKSYLKYRTLYDLDQRLFNIKGKLVSIDNKPLKALDKEIVDKVSKVLDKKIIDHLRGKELFSFQKNNKEEGI